MLLGNPRMPWTRAVVTGAKPTSEFSAHAQRERRFLENELRRTSVQSIVWKPTRTDHNASIGRDCNRRESRADSRRAGRRPAASNMLLKRRAGGEGTANLKALGPSMARKTYRAGASMHHFRFAAERVTHRRPYRRHLDPLWKSCLL